MTTKKRSLFEQELADVQTVSSTPRVEVHKQTKRQRKNKERARTNATRATLRLEVSTAQPVDLHFVEPHDHIEWKCSGVQPETMNKLRSGKYPIQEKLDLHNLRIADAFRDVLQFLSQCLEKRLRTVIIVHGIGLRSKPPAQMKSHVAYWLEQHATVNAFVTAPRHLGGPGATMVHLRKSKTAKLETKERIARRLG